LLEFPGKHPATHYGNISIKSKVELRYVSYDIFKLLHSQYSLIFYLMKSEISELCLSVFVAIRVIFVQLGSVNAIRLPEFVGARALSDRDADRPIIGRRSSPGGCTEIPV
jgi:hypothetical protein